MKNSGRRGSASKRAENQAEKGKKRGVSHVSGDKQHTSVKIEWPLEDQIRWAEWNLELLVSNPKSAEITASLPNRKDLEVWLLHKRDGLSLRQLARRFYGSVDAKSVSGMRRAIERAEKGHYGTSKFVGVSKDTERTLSSMLFGGPPGF